MEVPSEVLAELMCENCGGYLSRGSVHLMDNVKYRCGRCLPSEKEQGTRIEAYEELAKLMTFPCRYRENGCLSKVSFMENESHEEACPYRKYICLIGESGERELQNDSSIQTDINGLETKLVDITDTTFTVTIESVGIGTTTETSTAESSSANAFNTSPVKSLEAKAECSTCGTWTEPVYRRSWLCKNHAPERRLCENSTEGCMYSDVNSKCVKHVWHYCQYSTRCRICSEKITSKTLDAHHTQAHGDITHRAGTVCLVRPDWRSKYLIHDCEVGRAVCWYGLYDSAFVLRVHTPLPSEQLYKYRCTVEFYEPDTEHTLTRTLTVCYDRPYDWHVVIPLIDFNTYIKDKKVNIKITVTAIGEPSQFIL